MQNQSLYESVTIKIASALERGVVPWRKPWNNTASLPINAITQRPYRGVNTFLLGLERFEDHRWLTYRQAQELGGHVRQGEQSSQVVFWKYFEDEEDDVGNRSRRPPILRLHRVFNAEQCDGLNLPEIPPRWNMDQDERLTRATLLLDGMPDKPTVVHHGNAAWYSPSQDLIQIPEQYRFGLVDDYLATLFHEFGHATGHAKRLNRKGVSENQSFGSADYGQEELVAELTSAYCCATIGLDNSFIEGSASYIASWLDVLRSDPRMLVFAASQAQRAADYIRGIVYS